MFIIYSYIAYTFNILDELILFLLQWNNWMKENAFYNFVLRLLINGWLITELGNVTNGKRR